MRPQSAVKAGPAGFYCVQHLFSARKLMDKYNMETDKWFYSAF